MELAELSGEVELDALTPVPGSIGQKAAEGGDWMAIVESRGKGAAAAGEEAEAAPPPTPFCAALVDAFC